jgi:hypothetical protein
VPPQRNHDQALTDSDEDISLLAAADADGSNLAQPPSTAGKVDLNK